MLTTRSCIVSLKIHINWREKLNEDLSNVAVWLKENKLTLNLGKSKSMLIGSNQKLAKVSELSISIFNCSLGGVYMIPEWISFQIDSHGLFLVYVLILEWKCCKSIDGSKTWVSWSAQPIHLLFSVPEWTRTSFLWHWWNVQTDFVLERKFGSDATTGMKSFWNDSFRNTILVSIM